MWSISNKCPPENIVYVFTQRPMLRISHKLYLLLQETSFCCQNARTSFRTDYRRIRWIVQFRGFSYFYRTQTTFAYHLYSTKLKKYNYQLSLSKHRHKKNKKQKNKKRRRKYPLPSPKAHPFF